MGFLKRYAERKLREQMLSDPRARYYLEAIGKWGVYRNTPEGEEKAERAFKTIENYIGCLNPHTKVLFRDALINSGMHIPLAAVYAFALGEQVEPGDYYCSDYRSAQMNAEAMKLMFPEYGDYVERKHDSKTAMAVLALSLGFVDLFVRGNNTYW